MTEHEKGSILLDQLHGSSCVCHSPEPARVLHPRREARSSSDILHSISSSSTHLAIAICTQLYSLLCLHRVDWTSEERFESIIHQQVGFQITTSHDSYKDRSNHRNHRIGGPFSRKIVNFNVGCRTAMSNVVMATTVMITLLFLTSFFYYTPFVVLAAIINSAMIRFINYEAAFHLLKVDKFDFLICMGSYIEVVFGTIEIGLIITVRSVSIVPPKVQNL
ncbi:hypothetical protein Dimus_001094 [Dionaea muscipula]